MKTVDEQKEILSKVWVPHSLRMIIPVINGTGLVDVEKLFNKNLLPMEAVKL